MDIKNVNKNKETYKKTLTTGMLLIPVDIGTRLEIPVVNLTIRNPRGVFDVVGNSRGIEREIGNMADSVKTVINGLISILECNFTLKSGIDIGIEELFELPPQRAQSILCISCSLSNPTILFSPLIYSFTNSIIEETPHRFRCYSATILRPKKIEVEIDEAKIINIMRKILEYYNHTKKDIIEANIIESINSYQLALISTSSFLRYISLYQSFEKAVNADKDRKRKDFDCCGKDLDRRGKDFDHRAFLLTSFKESEIEKLRTFNNRIKHAFQREKDITTMEDRIEHFSENIVSLKKATDNAILYRMGINLSGGY